MRKTLTAAAATLLLAAAIPAYASDNDLDGDRGCTAADGAGSMSVDEITARVTAMGYAVKKVERDDGCFQIRATAEDGSRLEFRLDPATGEIVSDNRS